jgi:molecular chaperone GrpE
MSQHRVTDAPEDPITGPPDTTGQSESTNGKAGTDARAPVDVEKLQRERDDYFDRLMRKAAEFDNYRKRVERERREQADQAVVDLLRELLAVVDDFDIALAVEAGEGAASYRKGVELIHAKLHDLLRKYRVRPIEALGVRFDPNIHQAVIHEESPDHREGEVIGELRKGYMMGDRLLRPAMVKVAKA